MVGALGLYADSAYLFADLAANVIAHDRERRQQSITLTQHTTTFKMLQFMYGAFLQVADRTKIQTTDAERRTTSPEGMQDAIDELVKSFPSGRSFVRWVIYVFWVTRVERPLGVSTNTPPPFSSTPSV